MISYSRNATPVAIALAVFVLAGSAIAQDDKGLPGGATTLKESHGDWAVACAVRHAKRCGQKGLYAVPGSGEQQVASTDPRGGASSKGCRY